MDMNFMIKITKALSAVNKYLSFRAICDRNGLDKASRDDIMGFFIASEITTDELNLFYELDDLKYMCDRG